MLLRRITSTRALQRPLAGASASGVENVLARGATVAD